MSRMTATATLNGLVREAAAELMAANAATSASISEQVLSLIVGRLGQDFGFLRHNDHTVRATLLVAEWPPRNADPDPLGVVYFADADSIFAKLEHLKEPEVLRPEPVNADYQQTIEEGTGAPMVSLAVVPLLSGDVTTGVLGLGKLGDRAWTNEELNALRSIATLFAQLQGRITAEEQIRYLAEHDDLTGLLNRRTALARLDERLEAGMPAPVGVVFVDVDRLKAINDFLGQDTGNSVIVAVSESLRQGTDIPAVVARFGGDEFVVVPDAPMDADSALVFAQQLHQHVQERATSEGALVGRTVTIGVATGVPGDDTTSTLLSKADQATRLAKTSGGDSVAAYDSEMAAKEAICNEIELRLHDPDASSDLVLHYLPEFDIRTGEVLGTEALMRWQHPTRGLLMPESFISAAESIALASQLGRMVLRSACAQFARWQARGLTVGAALRVNVSPLQLVATGIVETVADTLTEFGLDPDTLCLEITERVVVADFEATRKTLNSLKDIGVKIALDDFGTGYSAFEYLTSLPIDVLKIDRGFVTDLGQDRDDQAVVRTIVALGNAVGLDVVAEGVETSSAAKTLLALGCWRAQGFLYSRPLDHAGMEALFVKGAVTVDYSHPKRLTHSEVSNGSAVHFPSSGGSASPDDGFLG